MLVCMYVCMYEFSVRECVCAHTRARDYNLFTHMEMFSHKHTRAQRALTRVREGGRQREWREGGKGGESGIDRGRGGERPGGRERRTERRVKKLYNFTGYM